MLRAMPVDSPPELRVLTGWTELAKRARLTR